MFNDLSYRVGEEVTLDLESTGLPRGEERNHLNGTTDWLRQCGMDNFFDGMVIVLNEFASTFTVIVSPMS